MELFDVISEKEIVRTENIQGKIETNGVSCDTRTITPGNVFFALAGASDSGEAYALQAVEKADIVLLVFDGGKIPDEYKEIKSNPKTICVFNKADVMTNPDSQVLSVSAKTGENVEQLKACVYDKIKQDNVSSTDVVITNARHIDCLQRANDSLKTALQNSEITLDCIALEIKEGWQALGEITGTTASEDVVTRIFEKFCVGK